MMKTRMLKDYRQTVVSLLVTLVLAFSLVPSAAFAQASSGNAQNSGNAQSAIQVESQAGSETDH